MIYVKRSYVISYKTRKRVTLLDEVNNNYGIVIAEIKAYE